MTLEKTLSSLEGQIAWMPQKGVGTFITMEFGAPHLVIREAIQQAPTSRLRRRNVTIVGEQHLWLQADVWDMHSLAGTTSSNDEPAAIKDSLRLINGQKLLHVGQDGESISFEFEYGERITLHPGPEPEQVLLILFWYKCANLSLLNNGTLVLQPYGGHTG